MNYLLFLPGVLFLLVIFLRVILPLIKEPRWKRLIDSARYKRHKKNPGKSDLLLLKAIESSPDRPEPYLEYYLNCSETTNLKRRFSVLRQGWEATRDIPLSFMMGSAYLEEGSLESALEFLEDENVLAYMRTKRVFILVHLLVELGRPNDAEEMYFSILNDKRRNREMILDDQTAQDICPYLFVLKARGEDPFPAMERIPDTSIRSEMGWKDLLLRFREMKESMVPAATGINGDPDNFNRRRQAFIDSHLELIESYLRR